MAAVRRSISPLQARSRRSLERLLDAAERLIAGKGVEGATVPAIAAEAGLATGTVYRRFSGKDALLCAVFDRFLERSAQRNRQNLHPDRWKDAGLRQIVHEAVRGMVRTTRANRSLMAGLLQFAERHEDRRLRQQTVELKMQAVRDLTRLLKSRTKEIRHPQPGVAIPFALMQVAATLWTFIGSETGVSMSDDTLSAELERALLSYLQVAGKQSR